ncbi:MAG: hypothetical protein R3290_11785 [Acidimicrobiia bacterium]|nr:hypothetical protein [Acidimicrobiia bacterium]
MARIGQSSSRDRPPRSRSSRPVGEQPKEKKPKAPSPIPLRQRWKAVGAGTLFSLGAQAAFFLAAWLIDRNGNGLVNFLPLTLSLFLTLTALEVVRRMTDAEWEGRNRLLAFVFALGFWLMLPSSLGVFGLAAWPMLAFGVGSVFAFGPGNRYNLRARLVGIVAATVYVVMFFLSVPVVGLILGALFPFVTIALADRFMERKAFAQTLRSR